MPRPTRGMSTNNITSGLAVTKLAKEVIQEIALVTIEPTLSRIDAISQILLS